MKKKKIKPGNLIIGAILILWGILIFYPFYNSILTSFMTQTEYMQSPFAVFVKAPTLVAYEEIFSDSKFFDGYKNVLTIMIFKLPISIAITTAMGYALSRKRFLFSKAINNLTVFTMYFGGGIIPLYLLRIIRRQLFSIRMESWLYTAPDNPPVKNVRFLRISGTISPM